jgi:hypothetical protein
MTPGHNSEVSRERESADILVCEMQLTIDKSNTIYKKRYQIEMLKDIFECVNYFLVASFYTMSILDLKFTFYKEKIL